MGIQTVEPVFEIARRGTDRPQSVVVVLADERVVGLDELLGEVVDVGLFFVVVEVLLADRLGIRVDDPFEFPAVVAAVVDPIQVLADRLGECTVDGRRLVGVPARSMGLRALVIALGFV
jgi:hypothetical protein